MSGRAKYRDALAALQAKRDAIAAAGKEALAAMREEQQTLWLAGDLDGEARMLELIAEQKQRNSEANRAAAAEFTAKARALATRYGRTTCQDRSPGQYAIPAEIERAHRNDGPEPLVPVIETHVQRLVNDALRSGGGFVRGGSPTVQERLRREKVARENLRRPR